MGNIIFILAGISLVYMEIKRTQFISLLRQCANDKWLDLGSPSGYFVSYLFKIDGFKLEKYIFSKEYEKLSNSEINSIGGKLFVSQVVAAVFMVAFILNLAIDLFTFTPSN